MIPLNQIKVASPCHESWNEMDGDAQQRFCQSCRRNVYNLSEMTREEAEALIRAKEGRLCVRFYRRFDGTVMTKDCPVGLRKLRFRAAAMFTWLLTLFAGGIATETLHASPSGQQITGALAIPQAVKAKKTKPHTSSTHSGTGSEAHPPPHTFTMGIVAVPPPHLAPTKPKQTTHSSK